eukprot:Rmarinus@m.23954
MGPKKQQPVEEPPADAPSEGGTEAVPEPDEGNGTFIFPDSSQYIGEWKKILLEEATPSAAPTPVPTGKGAPPPPEPDEHEPPKKQTKRWGKGTMTCGKNVYTGDWEDDCMHGFGKFTYESGAEYEGQWERNRYSGKGIYRWPEGAQYSGEWKENKMHGEGTYIDSSGKEWKGTFYNGTGPGLLCM